MNTDRWEGAVKALEDLNRDIANIPKTVDQAIAKLKDAENAHAAAVQQFLTDASPERRCVQEIKIGGSSDFLYPVFWQFPDNTFGLGKLEISRTFWWDKPHALHDTHVASLLLAIEGNGNLWGGDANFLRVKKYISQYNKTASHVQFAGFAHRRSTDDNPPSYGKDKVNYKFSGLFLRGGGLTYRISSNWKFDPIRLPDENDPNSERVLHTAENTQFYVTRIPVSELIEPVED